MKMEELDQTIVQCVFVGPPRNGKSSLMRRLIGWKPIDLQTLPSTGLAERVLQVQIEQTSSLAIEIKNSSSNASSLVWKELSFDDEVLKLLQGIAGNSILSIRSYTWSLFIIAERSEAYNRDIRAQNLS